MKEESTININGQDETISLKKITLIYDGSYGMNKITPSKKDHVVLDCSTLTDMYPQLTDEAIDWWITSPVFCYLWYTMWTGNIASTIGKAVLDKLPETQAEFDDSAPNVKHVFALLCATINAQATAVATKRVPYIKYPELGLHPGVQANFASVTMMLSGCGGLPPWLLTMTTKGKQTIKEIITRKEIS